MNSAIIKDLVVVAADAATVDFKGDDASFAAATGKVCCDVRKVVIDIGGGKVTQDAVYVVRDALLSADEDEIDEAIVNAKHLRREKGNDLAINPDNIKKWLAFIEELLPIIMPFIVH